MNPTILIDLSYTQVAPYSTGIVEYGFLISKVLCDKYDSIFIILSHEHAVPSYLPAKAKIIYIRGKVGSQSYWRNLEIASSSFDFLFIPYQEFSHKFHISGSTKLVMTIHDMTSLNEYRFLKMNTDEKYYVSSLKKKIYYVIKQILRFCNIVYLRRKAVLSFNAKKSYRIITDSYFSKEEILNSLMIPRKKIIVSYLPQRELMIEQKNNLKYDSFYLFVSSNRYLKNTRSGLLALDKLWDKGDCHKAILLGRPSKSLVSCSKHKEMIICEGYVSDEDMESLYKNAYMLVFPSVSEGYGIPPLQALKYGTRVAVSSAMSLKEIYSGVPMFSPYDIDGIVTAIEKAASMSKEDFLRLYKKIKKRVEPNNAAIFSIFKNL